jgi:hypothetical protein
MHVVPRSADRFHLSGVIFKPLTDELLAVETAMFIRRDQMHDTAKEIIGIALAGVRELKLNPIA